MRQLLLITAVATALALYGLNFATLFDVDEAVFSQATKEMMQRSDPITPSYNGINRYDKPILFYWLMWITYSIFGINEIGARLPSSLAGIALSVALFVFIKKPFHNLNNQTAYYAVIAFVTSLYYLIYTHAAVVDMTLTFCISMSLFSFYLYIYQDSLKRLHILSFYAFSALAFLTKGLIGIVFPFGIAGVFLLSTQGLRGLTKLFDIKGIAVFFLISAPWYTAQLYVNGWEFIEQFIIKHHFKRYTSVNSGHSGPFYYYLITLFVGMFPWSMLLPAGIIDTTKKRHPLQVFCLIWLAFVLVFFSISSTKLPNYILPAIPATAILIANGINQVFLRDRLQAKIEQILLAVIYLIASVGCFIAFEYALSHVGPQYWLYLCALILLVGAGLMVVSLFKQRVFVSSLCVVSICMILLLQSYAVPIVSNILQGTLHRYSTFIKTKTDASEKITVYHLNYPSIVFYSDRFVNRVFTPEEIKQVSHGFAIAKSKDKQAFVENDFEVIHDDGRFALLFKAKKD